MTEKGFIETCGNCANFKKCKALIGSLTLTSTCDFSPSRHSVTGDALCPDCGGPIAVRNPTGKCDHLYYPEYKNKKKVAPTREETIQDVEDRLNSMTPQELAEAAITLSGYLTRMTTEIAETTQAYYKKWCEIREYAHITTDGRAEKESKATDEYYKKKKLSLDYDATREMVNAIKKKLGFDEADYRQTGG